MIFWYVTNTCPTTFGSWFFRVTDSVTCCLRYISVYISHSTIIFNIARNYIIQLPVKFVCSRVLPGLVFTCSLYLNAMCRRMFAHAVEDFNSPRVNWPNPEVKFKVFFVIDIGQRHIKDPKTAWDAGRVIDQKPRRKKLKHSVPG